MNIIQIYSEIYGDDIETLMLRMTKNGIQTRPVWHLNHLQKPYQNNYSFMIDNAPALLKKSLCLPSSTKLRNNDLNYILEVLKKG